MDESRRAGSATWDPNCEHCAPALVGQVASDAGVSTTELLSQMLDEEASRGRSVECHPTVTFRYVRWTPDSRSIAFVNNAGGRSDIWLQPLDGASSRQLTHVPAEQLLVFDWSRDGRSLAFVSVVETSDAVVIRSKNPPPF
jgi:hypothetical protein